MTQPQPAQPDGAVDADRVVRRVAEQGAAALAEAWIRCAVLEAQAAAKATQ